VRERRPPHRAPCQIAPSKAAEGNLFLARHRAVVDGKKTLEKKKKITILNIRQIVVDYYKSVHTYNM
jgi:hypothetical protein